MTTLWKASCFEPRATQVAAARTQMAWGQSFQLTPHVGRHTVYQFTVASAAPCLRPLIQQALRENPDYLLDRWWLNVNSPAQSTAPHHHDQGLLSAVIYLQAEPNQGAIEFLVDDTWLAYTPRTGDIIYFPGHVEHRVTENHTDTERIALAVNLALPQQHQQLRHTRVQAFTHCP